MSRVSVVLHSSCYHRFLGDLISVCSITRSELSPARICCSFLLHVANLQISIIHLGACFPALASLVNNTMQTSGNWNAQRENIRSKHRNRTKKKGTIDNLAVTMVILYISNRFGGLLCSHFENNHYTEVTLIIFTICDNRHL